MVKYDPFGRTEGMRRQVNDLILTAYSKGYNDGEHDEQDRKLEMLLKDKKGKWIKDRLSSTCGGSYGVYRCSECENSYQDIGYGWNYCPNCGARMEEQAWT